MQIKEKSYTDWKDEAAHLTDEQFKRYKDILNYDEDFHNNTLQEVIRKLD